MCGGSGRGSVEERKRKRKGSNILQQLVWWWKKVAKKRRGNGICLRALAVRHRAVTDRRLRLPVLHKSQGDGVVWSHAGASCMK